MLARMESIQRKIAEAEDIADVVDLMGNLNIETKGCKTVEQMQERICIHLNSRQDHLDPNKASKVISAAQTMEKKKSFRLLTYYSEVEEVVSRLDDTFLNLLKVSEGDVLTNIQRRMERLEKREYVVLVAGETSAGKSSMLNLILGEELLPFSVLSTTSTICELKYGRERRIKLHFMEEGRQPEMKNLDDSASYMDQISEFVNVKPARLRERAQQYKKVELFCPHPLLKEGVVIVDSPGIGESEIMDDIVVNYLPNAFAFIYVINSGMAGGVQRDRLQQLLQKTCDLTAEQRMEFSPSCALFVCNKWDSVPPAEANNVMKHITQKLKQCLPDLDPNLQVMRISTAKALMVQKYDIMNAEFALLTENIGRLVEKSIETRLEQQWSWLHILLERIIWMMKSFVENAHSDKQRLNSVTERLRKLQAEQESLKKELREQLGTKFREALSDLIAHLKSSEVIDSFSRWDTEELPECEGSWEIIEAAIMKLVQRRLLTVIEEWEGDNKKFEDARRSVVSFFLRKYNYLENDLRGLEVNLSQGQVESKGGKEIGDIMALIFVPIVLVMNPFSLLLLPVVGALSIAGAVRKRNQKSAYRENPTEFVQKVAQKYLQEVSTYAALHPLVEDQVKQTLACLTDLEMKIPMLIEADVQLCQQLMSEEQSNKDTEATNKPLKEKCERLRGELGLLGALEIRSMHISWEDLEWDVSDEVFLQSVLPPGIYQGKFSKGRYAPREINLKVYKELLTKSNVVECLTDEATMRKLRHPNIVEFFGAAFRTVPRGVEAVFVLERPGVTLKSYLIDHPGNNPADNSEFVLKVIRWTQQIIEALIAIHSMFHGCVHGDLRLENVLLDSCNMFNIKLSNICLIRRIIVDHGSKCDKYLHLPPEAIRKMTYDTNSEIYSLGIMLWEMWYGKEAFTELKGMSLEEFVLEVEEGHRPVLTQLNTLKAFKWSKLISDCLKRDPTERKPLRDCADMIAALLST